MAHARDAIYAWRKIVLGGRLMVLMLYFDSILLMHLKEFLDEGQVGCCHFMVSRL